MSIWRCHPIQNLTQPRELRQCLAGYSCERVLDSTERRNKCPDVILNTPPCQEHLSLPGHASRCFNKAVASHIRAANRSRCQACACFGNASLGRASRAASHSACRESASAFAGRAAESSESTSSAAMVISRACVRMCAVFSEGGATEQYTIRPSTDNSCCNSGKHFVRKASHCLHSCSVSLLGQFALAFRGKKSRLISRKTRTWQLARKHAHIEGLAKRHA